MSKRNIVKVLGLTVFALLCLIYRGASGQEKSQFGSWLTLGVAIGLYAYLIWALKNGKIFEADDNDWVHATDNPRYFAFMWIFLFSLATLCFVGSVLMLGAR